MKMRKLIFLLSVVAAITACNFLNRFTPASGNAGKYQYIFKTAANPLHPSLELDKAHSVEAVIGPAGGAVRGNVCAPEPFAALGPVSNVGPSWRGGGTIVAAVRAQPDAVVWDLETPGARKNRMR